jgi:hypothetical protein
MSKDQNDENCIYLGTCIAPTHPFWAALGRQANSMSAHVLPPLAVNSKSERKIISLPPLEFEPVIFGMPAHLSDHSAKSHPQTPVVQLWFVENEQTEM